MYPCSEAVRIVIQVWTWQHSSNTNVKVNLRFRPWLDIVLEAQVSWLVYTQMSLLYISHTTSDHQGVVVEHRCREAASAGSIPNTVIKADSCLKKLQLGQPALLLFMTDCGKRHTQRQRTFPLFATLSMDWGIKIQTTFALVLVVRGD